MRERLLLVAVICAVTLVVVSCGSDTGSPTNTSAVTTTVQIEVESAVTTTADTVATTTVPDTTDEALFLFVDDESSLSFLKPEGFVSVDLTAGDIEEIILALEEEEGAELDGELRNVVDAALNQQGADFLYWAFDFTQASEEFVPNMNVIRLASGPFDQLEVYLEVLPVQYEQLGLEVVSIEVIDVTAGPAIMVVTSPPEGWIEYVSVQLLVPTDEFVFTMTFSFEDPESIDMDTVMRTLESFEIVSTS
jgi:hypothetical protein